MFQFGLWAGLYISLFGSYNCFPIQTPGSYPLRLPVHYIDEYSTKYQGFFSDLCAQDSSISSSGYYSNAQTFQKLLLFYQFQERFYLKSPKLKQRAMNYVQSPFNAYQQPSPDAI